MTTAEPQLLAQAEGGFGWVTLNRPSALNALTLPMLRALAAALADWRDDPAIAAVVIAGAGGRAFCAGGDIRFFRDAVLTGNPALEDFLTEEYTLDYTLATYPKPIVTLLDGIVMGGGMGVAQGGSIRIVTERARLAMPETLIGMFPDVGGSYFLSRMPGHCGEYLAVTGADVNASDALALGWADCAVPAAALAGLLSQWRSGAFDAATLPDSIDDVANPTLLPAPVVAPMQAVIDDCFSVDTLPHAVQKLRKLAGETGAAAAWAQQTLDQMTPRSPLLMAVAFEQIRRGRTLSHADCLRMERAMMRVTFHAGRLAGQPCDALEGIRALLVDKDKNPQWQPRTLDAVSPDDVAAFFAPQWPAAMHPLRHLQ